MEPPKIKAEMTAIYSLRLNRLAKLNGGGQTACLWDKPKNFKVLYQCNYK